MGIGSGINYTYYHQHHKIRKQMVNKKSAKQKRKEWMQKHRKKETFLFEQWVVMHYRYFHPLVFCAYFIVIFASVVFVKNISGKIALITLGAGMGLVELVRIYFMRRFREEFDNRDGDTLGI